MNKKLLGVIDATTNYDHLMELTAHRSLAAVPFAGRYRLIDFVLSSMVNSGIKSVAIFPKYQYRSLIRSFGIREKLEFESKERWIILFPISSFRCAKYRELAHLHILQQI